MNSSAPAVDPAAIIARAQGAITARRLVLARSLLAAAAKLGATSAMLGLAEARFALVEDRPADAGATLDRLIAEDEQNPDLRRLRAEAAFAAGDFATAAAHAAEAVILDRENPEAKALLGIVLIELGRLEDARACLAEALAQKPLEPNFRLALAEAEERRGALDAAAALFEEGVGLLPSHPLLRTAATQFALRRGDFATVVAGARAARAAGVATAEIFGMEGSAWLGLGQPEEAARAFEQASHLAPEDESLRAAARAAEEFAHQAGHAA